MDVFHLSQHIRDAYDNYARGNIEVAASDIRDRVAHELAQGTEFFQPPLIQLNARYNRAKTIAEAAAEGLVYPRTAEVFSIHGKPIHLFTHQVEAIGLAREREPYVVTTGTGSGKSLTYFVPIVDLVLRQLAEGRDPNLTAIVVYPMNALANSQEKELEKFLGGKEVRFARYTGQESREARQAVITKPPHILLTNYMMLELILSGHESVDAKLLGLFSTVKFLVFDELHTYRGRQGADVAMLCRRLGDKLASDAICVGTSATIVDNEVSDKRQAVADAASRIFGQTIKPQSVIFETLQRVTNPAKTRESVKPLLAVRIAKGFGDLSAESVTDDPLAIWVEMTLGMTHDGGHTLVRVAPRDIKAGARLLAEDAGLDEAAAEKALREFLLAATKIVGADGKSLIGFKLHLFFSGSGRIFVTLGAEGERVINFKDQVYVTRGDNRARLYEARFCRRCGIEYLPAVKKPQEDGREFLPRQIGTAPVDGEAEDFDTADGELGYLVPWRTGKAYDALTCDWTPGHWFETENQLSKTYRDRVPRQLTVDWRGAQSADGTDYLWVMKSAGFCPCCGQDRGKSTAEATELPALSQGGRSTASTLLTLACLSEMRAMGVDPSLHKVLGFTDNRQDASLQAGHFTDFVQALYLRGALLRATLKGPLKVEDLGRLLGEGLAFDSFRQRIEDWHFDGADPKTTPIHPILRTNDPLNELDDDSLRLKENLLLYTILHDFTMSWRYSFPNLEQLGLVEFAYDGVDRLVQNDRYWAGHSLLESATPAVRKAVCQGLLDFLRRKLCLEHEILSRDEKQRLWSKLSDRFQGSLMPDSTFRHRDDRNFACLEPVSMVASKLESRHTGLSKLSGFGLYLRQLDWGVPVEQVRHQLSGEKWHACIEEIISALRLGGLLTEFSVDGRKIGEKVKGYRLAATKIRVQRRISTDKLSRGLDLKPVNNDFLRKLFLSVASAAPNTILGAVPTASEHTAQVAGDERERREQKFAAASINALFCSPTMELGVDISDLDVVLMRNVPPTPANYAQRSGRAGRQGNPALVITYCSSGSPHDQNYYQKPAEMVQGVVKPPLIDLSNESLQQSHLHAIWLGTAELALDPAISKIIEIGDQTPTEVELLPLKPEIQAKISDNTLPQRASANAAGLKQRLVATGLAEADLERLVTQAITGAAHQFDAAFDRWRGLITAAASQRELNSRREVDFSLSQSERDRAGRQAQLSTKQIKMLRDSGSQSTEFYSYRYLASEGFLPGYNFPRLPIRAILTRENRTTGDREADTLSRPRFLGITEFGPRAVIYHEGQRYIVEGVYHRINPENIGYVDGALPTTPLRICEHCGYAHKHAAKTQECCHHCNQVMREPAADDNPWARLLEVSQVTTMPVQRITADEEERSRLGYLTKTAVEFSPSANSTQRTIVHRGSQAVVQLTYAASANLYRMLLGWRRGEQGAGGFPMEVATGRWLTQRRTEEAEAGKVQYVIPFVTETKNALLIKPLLAMDEQGFITFQYAFKRAIELHYQVEPSELAVDLLEGHDPAQKQQQIILYEASEGGAGVLVKLCDSPAQLTAIAELALSLCHFAPGADDDWAQPLTDTHSDSCVTGCYSCLLSYYNQPAHEVIDRHNPTFLGLLQALAGGLQVDTAEATEVAGPAQSSVRAWLHRNGYLLPQAVQAAGASELLLYPELNLAIALNPDQATLQRMENDLGVEVIVLPAEPSGWQAALDSFAELRGNL